jgi:hypothetical protein
LIGQPYLSLALLYVIVFNRRWCVVGSQPALTLSPSAVLSDLHPLDRYRRGLGVGRIGAIVGPAIGGMFIGFRTASTRDIFPGGLVPAAVSSNRDVLGCGFVVGNPGSPEWYSAAKTDTSGDPVSVTQHRTTG